MFFREGRLYTGGDRLRLVAGLSRAAARRENVRRGVGSRALEIGRARAGRR